VAADLHSIPYVLFRYVHLTFVIPVIVIPRLIVPRYGAAAPTLALAEIVPPL